MEKIRYCLDCMGIVIRSAFGYNPSGVTIQTAVVGILAWIVFYPFGGRKERYI